MSLRFLLVFSLFPYLLTLVSNRVDEGLLLAIASLLFFSTLFHRFRVPVADLVMNRLATVHEGLADLLLLRGVRLAALVNFGFRLLILALLLLPRIRAVAYGLLLLPPTGRWVALSHRLPIWRIVCRSATVFSSLAVELSRFQLILLIRTLLPPLGGSFRLRARLEQLA